jgi:hypothetical protein
MIRKLELEDCSKRKNLCETLQAEMGSDETIAQLLGFGDETGFHTSGKN